MIGEGATGEGATGEGATGEGATGEGTSGEQMTGEETIEKRMTKIAHSRLRHPERSRFSGAARDLASSATVSDSPAALAARRPKSASGPRVVTGLRLIQ
jgi:hypothetical protein